MSPKRKQRGVALITALLVVAIATVAAVEMARRQQLDIRRLQNLMAYDQAYSYAVTVESLALDILRKDLEDTKIDALDEKWHQPISLPYDGAQISVQVEDLQGRFNLNNLRGAAGSTNGGAPPAGGTGNGMQNPDYQRLIRLLDFVEAEDAPSIAAAVMDWLDEDIDPFNNIGAEDGAYLTGDENSRRPANGLMASASELRLVRGITPELFEKLEPLIVALPEKTSMNINTLQGPLFSLLGPQVDTARANQILRARPEEGWKRLDEAFNLPQLTGVQVPTDGFGVTSKYFAIHTTVTIGRVNATLHSVVKRESSNRLQVLQRGQGAI